MSESPWPIRTVRLAGTALARALLPGKLEAQSPGKGRSPSWTSPSWGISGPSSQALPISIWTTTYSKRQRQRHWLSLRSWSGKVRCGWWCQCCGRRKSSPTLVPSWARRGGGFQNHMGPTLQLWSPTRATWLPEPLSLMESKYPKHRVPRLSDHTQLCAAPSMVIPGHISRQQASVHTWTCLQNLCLLLVLFYHSRTVSSSLWPLAPLELIRSTTFLTFCIPDFREVSWSPPVLPFLSKDPNGWPAYFRCSKSVLHPIPALSPEPASSKDFSSPPPQPLLKCPLCVNMLFPGQHSQVSQHQRCLLKCSLCLFYNFSFKINLRVRNTAACYLESQFYVPHTFFLSSHALTD